MFRRNIKDKIQKALKRSPVVLLTGARQTGKTTLMQQLQPDGQQNYVTFDDIRFLAAAQYDPIGFIESLNKPVLLDEVQRVPGLFLTIKKDVDEHRTPGRYALTGSANPLLIPRLGDSLVGRMEIFTLYPLSQGELHNRFDHFIDAVFNQTLPTKSDPITKQELYQKIMRGGYPAVQTLAPNEYDSWFNSYVTTLLQRDIRDLAHIEGVAELPLLINILATRAGTLLNSSEISRNSDIPLTTLNRYLVLFQTLFLITFLSPWSSNLSSRLIKTPKFYFTDTGLLSFLLGTNITKHQAMDARLLGGLVENFVVSELNKQISWSDHRVSLFHFRTQTGIEVDIVLEDAAGNIVGIEVKNSNTVTEHDFRGLKYLQEVAGKKWLYGIVLYTGDVHVPFSKTLHALPISALWAA